jgi:23S rRNA pseudouridine2604 synthase
MTLNPNETPDIRQTSGTRETRLSKRVAEQHGCSRSAAEALIVSGRVLVDGVAVLSPQFRVDQHPITIDTSPLDVDSATETRLLHAQLGQSRHVPGLHEILPLDIEAQGLVILTRDRALIKHFRDYGHQLEQEFNVDVEGELAPYGLAKLREGAAQPMRVSWQSETRLRFAAKAIEPAQLRALCQQVGLEASVVKRLRIASIPLAKLAPGQWRHLAENERF